MQNVLIDRIMSRIPGRDGHAGRLNDTVFGQKAYSVYGDGKTPLNSAFYHRYYKVKGSRVIRRGDLWGRWGGGGGVVVLKKLGAYS